MNAKKKPWVPLENKPSEVPQKKSSAETQMQEKSDVIMLRDKINKLVLEKGGAKKAAQILLELINKPKSK